MILKSKLDNIDNLILHQPIINGVRCPQPCEILPQDLIRVSVMEQKKEEKLKLESQLEHIRANNAKLKKKNTRSRSKKNRTNRISIKDKLYSR